jgi:hypothetical protein
LHNFIPKQLTYAVLTKSEIDFIQGDEKKVPVLTCTL